MVAVEKMTLPGDQPRLLVYENPYPHANTIYHGLSEKILPLFRSESVNLIVTSPPYADQRKNTYGGIAPDKYVEWFLPISAELYRVLKPDGSFVLNIKERVVDGERHTYVIELILAMKRQGWLWTEEYRWHKKNSYPGKWSNRFRDAWEHCLHFTKARQFAMYQDAVMVPVGEWAQKYSNRRNLPTPEAVKDAKLNAISRESYWAERKLVHPSNVLHLPTETRNTGHSAAYPLDLPMWFIKLFTIMGDLIFDPFIGGGTSAVAAKQLGRFYVGIEKESKYFASTSLRIQSVSFGEALIAKPEPVLTNAEKRARVYVATDKPTIPSEVNSETPLEQINLNWSEKELPERERTKHVHRLHPYLGKYIPQLVEVFLRRYFKAGDTVLDPFCGSGTTLVQANELGINAIGCDVSQFNTLLCRVKLGKYDLAVARAEANSILDKLKKTRRVEIRQLSLWEADNVNAEALTDVDPYLKEWFAPQALEELLTYRNLIDSENYQYRDLLKIILSRSARSARLTTHFDLDFPKEPQTEPYWCYKHRRECKPTTEAFKFLQRYTSDTLKRVETFAKIQTNAQWNVFHGDSRKVKFPRIDGVITSPPYVGLIDYHEQHAYAYHLLGLHDQRDMEIGAAAKGTSKRAQEKYKKDIGEVFRRIRDSMVLGGRVIIVANDRSNLYDDIATMAGFEIENVLERHVNRRTGRRSGEFFESVFIWRKP